MTERLMDEAGTLWFVAKSLQVESDHELEDHLEHDCYAGMLVMQELILRLYPEGQGEVIEVAA